ncbi:hypothetical protein SDC9_06262 [bioreactor metagenome]|uniref:Uncharacterized protein n=1 Tax=bioreactor metagenome TaxID=1076179 RepID=A0A644T450_9ZZZZ
MPVPVALRLGFALVGKLLALGDAKQQLHPALLVEIHLQRHDGHALAPGGIPQPRELALRDEELAPAPLLMAEDARLLVGGDVAVDQPQLTPLDRGIAFGDVRLAGAQRLHLGAGQHDAGLERVLDGIMVTGLPVLGDQLGIGVGFLRHDRTEIGEGRASVQCGPRAT